MIGRNILFNALGGSWTIALYLLIIPIQIRVLGIDAYGLLAFIASLQVIFSIFDLGLSTTITREVAIDTSPGFQQSRTLLQTFTAGYGVIGILLGASLFFSADWLATSWLDLGALSVASARSVLQLAALAILFRWPVTLFAGVIVGRGRFDVLNLLKAVSATVGVLGGVIVILVFGNLVAFAAWTALSALIEVTLYLAACFRVIPGLSLRPRVSRQAIADVWTFARDMSLIYLLSIALMQGDRLLLSRLVPVEALGYYALAYNVLLGLTLLQVFVTTALFPSFAAHHHRNAWAQLVAEYTWATQGLVYVFTLPIAALVFFGYDLLSIWTSAETAAPTARILAILAPAFLFNAVAAISSTLAIATGHTGMIIRMSVAGLLVYLPIQYVAIVRWQAPGAATVWLVFNLVYLIALIALVRRRIVGQATMRWFARNLLPFLAVGAIAFGTARFVVTMVAWQGSVWLWIACAVATVGYGVCGLWLLDPALRRKLWALFKRLTRPTIRKWEPR